MKKSLITLMAVAFVLALALPVLAAKPNVQHFDAKFNIIGHPKNVDVLQNDASNGAAIFVPLKNVPNRDGLVCEFDGDALPNNDTEPTFTNVEPVGAKIHFQLGEKFDIIDRDATDADGALIQLPETGTYAIYLRVLGKPNQCMNINAYAYDTLQQLWFYSGSVYLNRKVGKDNANTTWISTQHMFDVLWCQVDKTATPPTCVEDTTEELNVFDARFSDYFWNILNDGTRLVQARLVKISD
jgi:hypothetical protein